MYKKILVPLDGSKRAERILQFVEPLARQFDSEVIFLRVVRPTSDPGASLQPSLIGKQVEKLEENAKAYLNGLRGEFRDRGIEARVHIVIGGVVRNILAIAKSESVDLIAMTSHGRGGIERVFYGSVAAGVLHQVDRPILLIRSR